MEIIFLETNRKNYMWTNRTYQLVRLIKLFLFFLTSRIVKLLENSKCSCGLQKLRFRVMIPVLLFDIWTGEWSFYLYFIAFSVECAVSVCVCCFGFPFAFCSCSICFFSCVLALYIRGALRAYHLLSGNKNSSGRTKDYYYMYELTNPIISILITLNHTCTHTAVSLCLFPPFCRFSSQSTLNVCVFPSFFLDFFLFLLYFYDLRARPAIEWEWGKSTYKCACGEIGDLHGEWGGLVWSMGLGGWCGSLPLPCAHKHKCKH